MKIDSAKIEALRALLAVPRRKVVVVAHTNPDGDAVGASTAWREVLAAMGHEVTMIVPNKYPYFLDWMPDIRELVIFRTASERGLEAIRAADLIFCLDFNSLSRLEGLGEALAENRSAQRVLIDHHLSPDEGFDLQFSYPEASSTCFLLYCIIERLCGTEVITRRMAESLYVGMMTDTATSPSRRSRRRSTALWRCWSRRGSTFRPSTTTSTTAIRRIAPVCSAMRSTVR